MFSWFKKKATAIKEQEIIEKPLFQLNETVDIHEQVVTLFFEDGSTHEFSILESMYFDVVETPTRVNGLREIYTPRHRTNLCDLRLGIRDTMSSGQSYAFYPDGESPIIVSMRNVRKITFSDSTVFGQDEIVNFIEEE